MGTVAGYSIWALYLSELSIYAIIFVARLGSRGLLKVFSSSKASRRKDDGEILRVGSDLALMGFGIFLGASLKKVFILHEEIPYILFFAFFLAVYVINYCLFLYLNDASLRGVLGNRKKLSLFGASLLIGFMALGVVIWILPNT